ncbi:MAG: glycosyltransferase [Lentimicrobiaceae bacterium]|jgi:glycosyltransferase involved in cell wall biosynthesis
MKKKRAIISVINDLVTDQRVGRTASVLADLGFEVLMVGRRKFDSPHMPDRAYETLRMRLLWEKGPLFYAEFNIRLFFLLLSRPAELLVSNDLDTLLPNYLVHKLKRIPVVYDSHEYFTATPELVNRPKVQRIWKWIEKTIVPKLTSCITINASIANLFEQEYHVKFRIVRNIPLKRDLREIPSRKALGLPEDKKIILMQGSGINIQRGAEEAVEAMQYIDNALLLIVGGGDVLPLLQNMVNELSLFQKVKFVSRQSPENLAGYTANADIGLAIDKDTNINYRYSLPNKLFDYIYAGVPVLATPLVELKNIIQQYHIGEFIDNHDPKHIAAKLENMLQDESRLAFYKSNTQLAATELNWENEKNTLIEIFAPYA